MQSDEERDRRAACARTRRADVGAIEGALARAAREPPQANRRMAPAVRVSSLLADGGGVRAFARWGSAGHTFSVSCSVSTIKMIIINKIMT